jgi:hypothetical protein
MSVFMGDIEYLWGQLNTLAIPAPMLSVNLFNLQKELEYFNQMQ